MILFLHVLAWIFVVVMAFSPTIHALYYKNPELREIAYLNVILSLLFVIILMLLCGQWSLT